MKAALEIYDCGKRFWVQARSAHKRTIDFLLRHQPFYVVGLDATTVEDSKCRGRFRRKPLSGQLAQKTVGVRRNFRRSSSPRADSPHWLVSQKNTRELHIGQRRKAAFKLTLQNRGGE